MDEDNDGRLPDISPVEVRYPRSKQQEQGGRSASRFGYVPVLRRSAHPS